MTDDISHMIDGANTINLFTMNRQADKHSRISADVSANVQCLANPDRMAPVLARIRPVPERIQEISSELEK